MSRAPTDARLDTRERRLRQRIRSEPYWRQILTGLFIGYRRLRGGGVWVARRRVAGRYVEQRIGLADDHADADGRVVFSYSQAVRLAQRIAEDENVSAAPRHHGDGWTVMDCIDHYLETELADSASKSSVSQSVRLHTRASIGPKLVRALTAEDYRRWQRQVASSPRMRRGREQTIDPDDVAAVRSRRATTNRVWGTVRAAIDYAWRAGKIPDASPEWQKVEPLSLGPTPTPRMLDEFEIRRLLHACEGDIKPLVEAALLTGARYGELCRLRVRDFSPDTRTVRIVQSKSSKTLWQPITPEGARFFERATAGRPQDAHILTRPDGKPWGKSQQARRMQAVADRAGIEDFTFKVTRATYGKLLLLATKDIELVAKALGHSSSRVTRQHYAQYLPSEVAIGIERMPSLGIADDSSPRQQGRGATHSVG